MSKYEIVKTRELERLRADREALRVLYASAKDPDPDAAAAAERIGRLPGWRGLLEQSQAVKAERDALETERNAARAELAVVKGERDDLLRKCSQIGVERVQEKVRLAAVTAERDAARMDRDALREKVEYWERQNADVTLRRSDVAPGELFGKTEELPAEASEPVTVAPCDCAEVVRLRGAIREMGLERDMAKANANAWRTAHDKARAELDGLTADHAAAASALSNLDGAVRDSLGLSAEADVFEALEAAGADLVLARMVRAMPPGCSLVNDESHPGTFPWECRIEGHRFAHNDPADALRAGGVVIADPPTVAPGDTDSAPGPCQRRETVKTLGPCRGCAADGDCRFPEERQKERMEDLKEEYLSAGWTIEREGDGAITFTTPAPRPDAEDTDPAPTEPPPSVWICKVLVVLGAARSNGDAGRIVGQGGVTFNGEKVEHPDAEISDAGIVRVGPRLWYWWDGVSGERLEVDGKGEPIVPGRGVKDANNG